MNYSEALVHIDSLEFKEQFYNNPFSAYSLMRDCIGNSYEYIIITKCFLEINKKINVFNVLKQYGVEKGLNIMKQAYKDLFSDIPLEEYKSVIKPIALLFESDGFKKKKLNKKESSPYNYINLNTKTVMDSNNLSQIIVKSTIGDIKLVESNDLYVEIKSECPECINARWRKTKQCIDISLKYKKKSNLKTTIEIGVPNGKNKCVEIHSGNYDVTCLSNINNAKIYTLSGDIYYFANSSFIYLYSDSGLVHFNGKSDFMYISSR